MTESRMFQVKVAKTPKHHLRNFVEGVRDFLAIMTGFAFLAMLAVAVVFAVFGPQALGF